MTPRVMQLLVTLRMGGAERLALSILHQGRGGFSGLVAGLFQPPGDVADAAAELDIPWLALRAETGGRVHGIRALHAAIRRHNVTLLHAQAAYLLPYALPAAMLAGISVVYTEHALHSLQTLPRLRFVVRLAAPFLHEAVCVSEPVARYFSDALNVRATVIRNGVDTERFTPESPAAPLPWETSGENGFFVFGQVARLAEAKDQQTLLRAFALVHREHPRTRLLLVGEGEERPALEALRAELGLGDAVHMRGAQSDIPGNLRAMDVFVLSSKREGLPMAVLEAMACGVAVVSTEVGAVASLNAGGEHLALTTPGDPAALARQMERLLQDNAGRRRMARHGMEFVRQEYSAAAMAAEYDRIYRKKERQ